jgi:signal transduction protein with GAF and PtsI domain
VLDVTIEPIAHLDRVRRRQDAAMSERARPELRRAIHPSDDTAGGELAGDPLAVPLLLGLGVRELSVSAAAVASVKEVVRATDLAAAAELARQALDLRSAEAVRDLMRSHRGADMTYSQGH